MKEKNHIYDRRVPARLTFTRLIILFLALILIAGHSPVARTIEASQTTAFINVNVIPIDSERVIENQTVIVSRGRISEIGAAAKTKIPRGALRIDGRGKFLLPGLSDMHIHTLDKSLLVLYLANGVTTVRNMSGEPFHLDWRRQIASGQLSGPTLYTAGPTMESDARISGSNIAIVKTREEAERSVAEQKRAGYDLIKVYSHLTPEAYEGIMSAAKRLGLQVSGHSVRSIGLEAQLKAGQSSIEHAEEYIYAFFNFKTDDDSKIPYIVEATRKAGTWVTPTLVTYDYITRQIGDIAELMHKPELKYIDPSVLKSWGPEKNGYRKRIGPDQVPKFKQSLAFQKRLVKALRNAGVRILVGTDAGDYGGSVPFVIPGFSIHEELSNLVESGLTPFEAIRAATRDAADSLKKLDEFGTVSVGKRADLILTRDNPLKDISTLSKPLGVMVGGRWMADTELRAMIDDLPALYVRESEFINAILKEGARQAIEKYRAAKKINPRVVFFRENTMNSLGYRLIDEKRAKEALEIFKLNAEAYPWSADVYDSLAEAYLLDGDKELAIRNYEKSLALNPQNTNATEMLKKLKG